MTTRWHAEPVIMCAWCSGRLERDADREWSHTDASQGFDCANECGDQRIIPLSTTVYREAN